MNETPEQGRAKSDKNANRRVAFACLGVFCMMVGISFAAVPLYRIFCQATGFAGTTRVATAAPDMTDREAGEIYVRFDANVSSDMPWVFEPVERVMKVKLGEPMLAHYRATNQSDHDVVGTATFNVTPDAAGYFFNKIQCFCFVEQKLAAGQSIDMPVTFFVDPDIAKDMEARNITTITLSYTFFPKSSPKLSKSTLDASKGNPG
jgi:cytochrome c oxidase assembly protein subunit 11